MHAWLPAAGTDEVLPCVKQDVKLISAFCYAS